MEDPEQTIKFPVGAALDQVIDRMIAIGYRQDSRRSCY